MSSTAGLRKAGGATRRGNMRMAGKHSGDVLGDVYSYAEITC